MSGVDGFSFNRRTDAACRAANFVYHDATRETQEKIVEVAKMSNDLI